MTPTPDQINKAYSLGLIDVANADRYVQAFNDLSSGYATSLNADIGNYNRSANRTGLNLGFDIGSASQDLATRLLSGEFGRNGAVNSNALNAARTAYITGNVKPFATTGPNVGSSDPSTLGQSPNEIAGTAGPSTTGNVDPNFIAHNQGFPQGQTPSTPQPQTTPTAQNQAPGGQPAAPLAVLNPPTPGLTPQFIRNSQTGQIAQIVPGGLKGFGTYQEFQQAQGGSNSQPMDVSPEEFSTYASGQHPASPSAGTPAGTGTVNPDGSVQQAAPADFIADYQNIIKQLGLTDIKSAFQDIQKQSATLAQEKADKVANIQNDPWMSQGVKDRNIQRINDSYATKEDILTHKQQLYDSLYKEGLQQAQFLATGEYNQQRDAAALAEKKQEAIDKLKEADIHEVTFNGRVNLVDFKTHKVVADLGTSPKVANASTNNYFGAQNSGSGIDSYAQTSISGLQYVDSSQFQGKARDEAAKQATLAGIPFISKEQAEAIQEIDNARLNQQSIIEQISPLLPHDAQGRILGGAVSNKLSKVFQTNDQIGAFNSWRTAAINTLRATAGSKGLRINQAEIQAAIANDIPTLTDTVGVAQQKFNNIQKLLNNAEKSILIKNRNSLGTSGGAGKTKSGMGYKILP